MARRKQNSSIGTWIVVALLIFGGAQLFRADDSPRSSASRPEPANSVVQGQPAPITTLSRPSQASVVETRYITASSLNVRGEPSTSGQVLASIGKGQIIDVLDNRGGWLLIRLSSTRQGWVSAQYTSTSKPAHVYVPPAPISQPSTASASGLSCSPRRTCGQISSCSAARWYLQTCSWGGRLDRDNDGRPCEAMC
jgi:hypothetical protein